MDNSALAGKIQKLHIFFSLLIPDMTHEERQLLDEALIKTYAKKGITHKNESLIDPLIRIGINPCQSWRMSTIS